MNILDKLKRKFFVISVSLVGAVLFTVFLSIFLYSYRVLRISTDDYLNKAISQLFNEGDLLNVPFFMRGDNESQATFIYELGDGYTNYIAGNINRKLKDEVIEEVVSQINPEEKLKGYVLNHEFKYQLVKIQNGNHILFLVNISPQLKMMRILAKSLVSSFVFTMIVIGIISKYLIDKALEPVEYTWGHQKQFIADASHELKTPLTVILANLKILKRYDNYDNNQLKWIDNTVLETRRMKELVEEMLFLAKRDSGNMSVTMEKVNFTELVEEVILTFESIAFENNLEIVIEEIQDYIVLNGDKSQLKRLIIILIDNACKYSKPGNNIYIKLCRKEKKLIFSVTSIGTPIEEKYGKRIFERFVRESKSRSRDSQGGYGLGLAIAKSIVQTHNGKIYWNKFEDRGNTFTVELPF
ncbi:MAG: HAMP domain-containing sensor histidine kinase [Lagierella massiliensis]|nr:HAMP domain-containing sensor histidine kinase [Lagierella massiliensis]